MLRINCCRDCVPPKRHPGCHSACEEYIKAKEQYEKDKKKNKEMRNPIINRCEFVGNEKPTRNKKKRRFI